MPNLRIGSDCFIPAVDLDASMEALQKKKKAMHRYADIMAMADDPGSAVFQKRYCGFYRVRRNAAWRSEYFRLMETLQQQGNASFAEILQQLYQSAGQVEASFSSKLLATLNDDMPIWDSMVLTALQLRLTGSRASERLANAVILYDQICRWYQAFLQTETAKDWVRRFDCEFPEFASFSRTKKTDYILWASR